MNTTQANKLDILLNYNIRKSEQIPKATLRKVLYVDPNRILMVRAYVDDPEDLLPWTEFSGYEKKEVGTINKSIFDYCLKYGTIASFDRKTLIKILDSMDSDSVTIRLDTDSPIHITGKTGKGEVTVESALAPLIFNDQRQYYADEVRISRVRRSTE